VSEARSTLTAPVDSMPMSPSEPTDDVSPTTDDILETSDAPLVRNAVNADLEMGGVRSPSELVETFLMFNNDDDLSATSPHVGPLDERQSTPSISPAPVPLASLPTEDLRTATEFIEVSPETSPAPLEANATNSNVQQETRKSPSPNVIPEYDNDDKLPSISSSLDTLLSEPPSPPTSLIAIHPPSLPTALPSAKKVKAESTRIRTKGSLGQLPTILKRQSHHEKNVEDSSSPFLGKLPQFYDDMDTLPSTAPYFGRPLLVDSDVVHRAALGELSAGLGKSMFKKARTTSETPETGMTKVQTTMASPIIPPFVVPVDNVETGILMDDVSRGITVVSKGSKETLAEIQSSPLISSSIPPVSLPVDDDETLTPMEKAFLGRHVESKESQETAESSSFMSASVPPVYEPETSTPMEDVSLGKPVEWKESTETATELDSSPMMSASIPPVSSPIGQPEPAIESEDISPAVSFETKDSEATAHQPRFSPITEPASISPSLLLKERPQTPKHSLKIKIPRPTPSYHLYLPSSPSSMGTSDHIPDHTIPVSSPSTASYSTSTSPTRSPIRFKLKFSEPTSAKRRKIAQMEILDCIAVRFDFENVSLDLHG
jgi:hypothetical protein